MTYNLVTPEEHRKKTGRIPEGKALQAIKCPSIIIKIPSMIIKILSIIIKNLNIIIKILSIILKCLV